MLLVSLHFGRQDGASNALNVLTDHQLVLSRYIWRIAEKTPTDWESKGVAVAAYTLAVICVIANNKFSLWATNVLGVFKIALLVVISITGFVALGGHTSVPNPGANFDNAFEGTTTNGNDLSSAMVNIAFAYSGYQNAFNVVAEIKRPIPTLKKYATISVLLVAVLYMLCNIAYFAAVPKEEFAASKEIAAGVFFTAVFGSRGSKALNVLVLLSAFGNLLAVLIGQSRLIREIGRQGVLPWTQFWVSTRPFGTPIGPYLLKWAVTFIMIVGPPAGDAFQFGKFEGPRVSFPSYVTERLTYFAVVSLKTYPDSMFLVAMTLGVYIFRYRYKRVGRERAEFKAWDVAVIFYLLTNVYLLVMPWFPPEGGPYAGDVSFWYATYCVVGIGILVVCGLYYIAWMYVLPRLGKYEVRPEILVDVDNRGATTHRLVRVPRAEVAEWDANHDEAGNLRQRHVDVHSGHDSAEKFDKSAV